MKRRESFGPGDLAIQNVSTSNLISGGASADYDTLKEIEDKIKSIEENGTASINEIKIVGELDSVVDLNIAGKVTSDGGEILNDYKGNKATGQNSLATGSNNTASGNSSHAEGQNAQAVGNYSHAEGYSTTAHANYSHAEGSGTYANADCQHVQGKYNKQDTEKKYAFIIGNGTNALPSNAFAIDWNGLIYVNNASTGVNVATLASTISTMSDTITSLEARIAALEGNTTN